jgi:signal transduction histidine kinase
VLRSSSVRLAALYTAGFAIGVLLLGMTTFLATRSGLVSQFEQRIRTEATALAQEYRVEGLNGVEQAVRERDHIAGDLDYGLEGPAGAAIAGRLARAHAGPGWSTVRLAESGEKVRVYAIDLGRGYRLLVGDDDERIEAVEHGLVVRFAMAFLGVLVLGALGGVGLSRGVERRFAAITDTAEAIIHGDLGRRVPERGAGDDLDRLATTLNRMLDRIQALMESLRQVSNDIAHDLRTPLTRLRQRLEEAGASHDEADRTNLIEAAVEELEGALRTFDALLRIAQIESGARRAAFRPADLMLTARAVTEAFAPAAEDAGARLLMKEGPPAYIDGDPELLAQMLVNLVENALRHGGPEIVIEVTADGGPDGGVCLTVTDSGTGVPESERERLFDRFYRLEASRSTPGSGLGLALVAAVATFHGAKVELRNRSPGLEARVAFPARAV